MKVVLNDPKNIHLQLNFSIFQNFHILFLIFIFNHEIYLVILLIHYPLNVKVILNLFFYHLLFQITLKLVLNVILMLYDNFIYKYILLKQIITNLNIK